MSLSAQSEQCPELLPATSDNLPIAIEVVPMPQKNRREKRRILRKIKKKYRSFREQKNAIILLILCEMQHENGALLALSSDDQRLQNFRCEWSLKYIKLFRAFAVT